jgi:hypothetical protein
MRQECKSLSTTTADFQHSDHRGNQGGLNEEQYSLRRAGMAERKG